MHATKAAVEEGIVGRGRRVDSRVEVLEGLKLGGDQQIGVNIVKRAIEADALDCRNASMKDPSSCRKCANEDSAGFNAHRHYEDLVSRRIDPTKVVRSALQNSSSIASLLLTTEALICDMPEEKKSAPQGGGPGGGMGGMY
jgi:chaperonin GroEL